MYKGHFGHLKSGGFVKGSLVAPIEAMWRDKAKITYKSWLGLVLIIVGAFVFLNNWYSTLNLNETIQQPINILLVVIVVAGVLLILSDKKK